MYSRQEASQLKQQFWTVFGQYMNPIVSAEGEKINWINYKTGEKNIAFRMNADNKKAIIAIEITHNDLDIQHIIFDQFEQFKTLMETTIQEKWAWQLHSHNGDGKIISMIFKEKNDVTIFKKEDWPGLISFFKPRIIALDEFWSNVKYAFELLR